MAEVEEEQQPQSAQGSALASPVPLLSLLDRPADPQQLRHLLGEGSEPPNADDVVPLARRLDVQARKTQAKSCWSRP